MSPGSVSPWRAPFLLLLPPSNHTMAFILPFPLARPPTTLPSRSRSLPRFSLHYLHLSLPHDSAQDKLAAVTINPREPSVNDKNKSVYSFRVPREKGSRVTTTKVELYFVPRQSQARRSMGRSGGAGKGTRRRGGAGAHARQ
ncbi:hypothetical protein E2C01_027986 [Portunus trituberculatus]|uniref:Uncharacterized protein n=1 Tax=Portunus trituberculatus TaxID=210409 RepID=A0A5B7EK55_PORTR|nr:hypothetical protein [Portunus trituberculatus]